MQIGRHGTPEAKFKDVSKASRQAERGPSKQQLRVDTDDVAAGDGVLRCYHPVEAKMPTPGAMNSCRLLLPHDV